MINVPEEQNRLLYEKIAQMNSDLFALLKARDEGNAPIPECDVDEVEEAVALLEENGYLVFKSIDDLRLFIKLENDWRNNNAGNCNI